jgi:hypothetical protein
MNSTKTICKDLGHLLFIDQKGRDLLVCLSDHTLSQFSGSGSKELYSVSSLHLFHIIYDLKEQPLLTAQNIKTRTRTCERIHIQKTSDSSEKYLIKLLDGK